MIGAHTIRRRACLYALLAVVPLVAWSCRKSHASAEKRWALEVGSRGGSLRRTLRYWFPKTGWGRYRLAIKVKATGVRCVGSAVAHLEIHARQLVADRGVLEIELTDFQESEKRTDSLVGRVQKIYWEMSPSGRTVRFSAEDLHPALITGLPDIGLLLRRMLPVLPVDPVGVGARWRVLRPFEMGMNPESGSGFVHLSERAEYQLAALGSSAGRAVAKVEGQVSAEYSGLMSAVARDLGVKGKGTGTVSATLDVETGRLLDARLEFSDRLNVSAGGNDREVRTTLTARLTPRTD